MKTILNNQSKYMVLKFFINSRKVSVYTVNLLNSVLINFLSNNNSYGYYLFS